MAGPSEILTAVQNGVVAMNNLAQQATGSLYNISGQLTSLTSSITTVSCTVTALSCTVTTLSSRVGSIGEYIESVIPATGAISLATGVSKNVTSINLPIGSWDVNAICYHLPAAATSVTRYVAEISPTSSTITGVAGRFSDFSQAAFVSGGNTFNNAIPPYRFNVVVSSTPVYMVALDFFTISTMSAYGLLRATRATAVST